MFKLALKGRDPGTAQMAILIDRNERVKCTMKGLKSSLQRLYKSVSGSREQWKEKAKERHRTIRAQAVKIRDLEKSRAQWKEKAKALQAERDKVAQAEAEAEAEAKNTTADRIGEGEWLPAAAGRVGFSSAVL